MGRDLPSGRVTFAFTDVVGSTRAFAEHGAAYISALKWMHGLIAETAAAHGGVVVSREGDGAFLAFPDAPAALDALCALQDAMQAQAKTGPEPVLRLRAGAHTGHAVPVADEYVALAVHVAARISATAGAGQIFVSQAVEYDLDAPRGEEMGPFVLKDIAEPVVLWRVVGDGTAPRATPARRTNVAVPRTSFVGRRHDLATLRRLLAAPGIVTITGPGGLGKTRLVSELALQQSEQLAGGVWLTELASLDDPDRIPSAVSAGLGRDGISSVDGLVAELQRLGPAQLILDSCEHVVDAVAELAVELSNRCPLLRIACTSREALMVEGEQVLQLGRLATSTDEQHAGEAEKLFLSRASAAGAALDKRDLAAVSRVCRQLDGLPLALELAAARIPNMPVAELADALEAGELQLQRRGGQRHQRSLKDLVSWSLRLLAANERTALQALSVFPGRFTTSDAKEVLAGVPEAADHVLPELARRSLVDLDGDHFRLLVTIRDVARAELRERPETWAAAHSALFGWALRGCPNPGMPSIMFEDFDHALSVEAALVWGLEAGAEGLSRLMFRLRSWAQRSGGTLALRELALGILGRPVVSTADEIMLQSAALDIALGLGWQRPDSAIVIERALQLIDAARAAHDDPALYEILSVAATVLSKSGQQDEARTLVFEALELTSRDPQLHRYRGMELANLAITYYNVGDLATAEDYLTQAAQVATELGDAANVAVSLCNLGEILLDRAKPDVAAVKLREALRAARGLRLPTMIALALLVEAEAGRGDYAVARELAGEAEREIQQLCAADQSLSAQFDRFYATVRRLPDAAPAS